MFFASDNAAPVHPNVIAALTEANTGHRMGYGADDEMNRVRDLLREVFEAPEAMVHLVATGTTANVLLLSTLTEPWETIFCTPESHINCDECNAPEFYSGAKLTLVPSVDAKMTPEALQRAIEKEGQRGVHGPQRGPVSITSVTERGTVYSVDEIEAISTVAKEYNLPVHLDGARFANAMVSLGCSPAEMSWKAGVDAVSFGGTKNGLMGVEACILFDPSKEREFELRRKRGGHLFSKHRYLSAQMLAYLTDDLWQDMARQANSVCARLTASLGDHPVAKLLNEPSANMIFFTLPRAEHQRLLAGGAVYYVEDGDVANGPSEERLTGRLVTDWSMDLNKADEFLALLDG